MIAQVILSILAGNDRRLPWLAGTNGHTRRQQMVLPPQIAIGGLSWIYLYGAQAGNVPEEELTMEDESWRGRGRSSWPRQDIACRPITRDSDPRALDRVTTILETLPLECSGCPWRDVDILLQRRDDRIPRISKVNGPLKIQELHLMCNGWNTEKFYFVPFKERPYAL